MFNSWLSHMTAEERWDEIVLAIIPFFGGGGSSICMENQMSMIHDGAADLIELNLIRASNSKPVKQREKNRSTDCHLITDFNATTF